MQDAVGCPLIMVVDKKQTVHPFKHYFSDTRQTVLLLTYQKEIKYINHRRRCSITYARSTARYG
jgi:hypothetical protein